MASAEILSGQAHTLGCSSADFAPVRRACRAGKVATRPRAAALMRGARSSWAAQAPAATLHIWNGALFRKARPSRSLEIVAQPLRQLLAGMGENRPELFDGSSNPSGTRSRLPRQNPSAPPNRRRGARHGAGTGPRAGSQSREIPEINLLAERMLPHRHGGDQRRRGITPPMPPSWVKRARPALAELCGGESPSRQAQTEDVGQPIK